MRVKLGGAMAVLQRRPRWRKSVNVLGSKNLCHGNALLGMCGLAAKVLSTKVKNLTVIGPQRHQRLGGCINNKWRVPSFTQE